MSKIKELIEDDYEYDYLREQIFSLEREKEIEASWQEFERKPTKIELVYETRHPSSTFRRNTKKILLLRSRLYLKADRTTV